MQSRITSLLLSIILVALLCSVAYAAGGGGAEHHVDSGVLLKDFLYRLLNFSLVVALLAYFLRKPLKKALSGRREEIEKALAEAEQAKREAEAKFAEYDRKLNQATAEIAEISASIKSEGEKEKAKIIEYAKAMARQIEADAGKAADLEVARARAELQREAVELAVATAEELLKKKFTKDDNNRLIDEYMQKVGELQ